MHVVQFRKSLAYFIFLVVSLFSSVSVAAEKAPNFVLGKSSKGTEISLSHLKGRVVYLDFWASWCIPCLKSFPWMNEMREKYAEQGLKVIAVSLDHDKDLARRFADEFEAEFTIGFDTRSELADQFDVRGLPASVLISRKGKMLAMHAGFNDEQAIEYESEIVKALN